MPETENIINYQKIDKDVRDDIAALSHVFSLTKLNYVDIDLRERLAEITTRWPLIHELMLQSQREQSK